MFSKNIFSKRVKIRNLMGKDNAELFNISIYCIFDYRNEARQAIRSLIVSDFILLSHKPYFT